MCKHQLNRYRQPDPAWDRDVREPFESNDVLQVHRSLPEYQPTPLISLPGLAKRLGVGEIFVKDESHRFGLKAFKALGATYAIYRFIKRDIESHGGECPNASTFYRRHDVIEPRKYTFCTATDGNHGRGVAWAARKLNQRAVIYMPRNSVIARIEAIRSEGAEVIIVNGNYDQAVSQSIGDAEQYGWNIISDTSWQGYCEIPRWIMAGYLTMFKEIHELSSERHDISLAFVQGGVGALAAAASWYYNKRYTQRLVKLVSVEPTDADCLLASIRSPEGNATSSCGAQLSIMAGLNCGTPSHAAWPLIKTGFDLFLTIPDEYAVEAMRTYYHPIENDRRIVSGESGAAGLAALTALCESENLRDVCEHLRISRHSGIMLLNTEGDTDPDNFRRVVQPR